MGNLGRGNDLVRGEGKGKLGNPGRTGLKREGGEQRGLKKVTDRERERGKGEKTLSGWEPKGPGKKATR